MKCYLMNKNTKIMMLEYNDILDGFEQVYEILNIEYAPLNVYHNSKNNDNLIKELNKWFKDRCIPNWRDGLEYLLYNLDIKSTDELLNKAYALSLSDQYWIKPINSELSYDEINFFDNEFDSVSFTESMFLSEYKKSKHINLLTPNNTTDGMLKKTWIIENKKRILVKGGYKNSKRQPINEYLASIISEKLGFNAVKYTLDIINNSLVSKCECFINKNTELISAHNLFLNYNHLGYKEDYEYYISILENHGIKNVREKLENMIVLDYLIMNTDRHLGNFGIIRDVNTLKWLDVAPIFDNGESMQIIDYSKDTISVNESGRLFFEIVPFNDFLKLIKDFGRFDFDKLNEVVEVLEKTLKKYQKELGISDDLIFKLCFLLNSRINKLKSFQK